MKKESLELIKRNKETELQMELDSPMGVLALFHYDNGGTSTQRIIFDKSDMLQISKDFNRDSGLGAIDYSVRKKVSISDNRDLSISIMGYLPHTNSYKTLSEFSSVTNCEAFIMNFEVHSKGISTRQIQSIDFETWKEVSTSMQVELIELGTYKNTNPMLSIMKQSSPKITKTQSDIDKENKLKGMNRYHYGSEWVWAINKKNADKKAKKLGYIK
jgi:hypothetical protein